MSDGRTLYGDQGFMTRFQDMQARLAALEQQQCRSLRGPVSLLRNGAFDIWQRDAGPFTTSGGVTADGFACYATGSTFSTTRQAFALGNVIPGQEPAWYLRCAVTTSAGASNFAYLAQLVEDARTVAGQTVTVSFWAKADAAKPIAVELGQNFGSGGSPSAQVNTLGAKVTLSTSWTRYTVTVNVPSVSGKTFGSNGDSSFQVRLWMDAGSTFNARTGALGQQSGTFDFWGIQAEAGSAATSFDHPSPAATLAECKRYLQVLTDPPLRGIATSALAVNRLGMWLPVTMRAVPIVTITGTVPLFDGSGVNGSFVSAGVVTAYHTTDRIELTVNSQANWTAAGRPVAVYNNSSASTFTVSAEL